MLQILHNPYKLKLGNIDDYKSKNRSNSQRDIKNTDSCQFSTKNFLVGKQDLFRNDAFVYESIIKNASLQIESNYINCKATKIQNFGIFTLKKTESGKFVPLFLNFIDCENEMSEIPTVSLSYTSLSSQVNNSVNFNELDLFFSSLYNSNFTLPDICKFENCNCIFFEKIEKIISKLDIKKVKESLKFSNYKKVVIRKKSSSIAFNSNNYSLKSDINEMKYSNIIEQKEKNENINYKNNDTNLSIKRLVNEEKIFDRLFYSKEILYQKLYSVTGKISANNLIEIINSLGIINFDESIYLLSILYKNANLNNMELDILNFISKLNFWLNKPNSKSLHKSQSLPKINENTFRFKLLKQGTSEFIEKKAFNIHEELNVLKLIKDQIDTKDIIADKNLNYDEFVNFLNQYDLSFPNSVKKEIFNYFATVKNKDTICFKDIEECLDQLKLINKDFSSKEVFNILEQIDKNNCLEEFFDKYLTLEEKNNNDFKISKNYFLQSISKIFEEKAIYTGHKSYINPITERCFEFITNSNKHLIDKKLSNDAHKGFYLSNSLTKYRVKPDHIKVSDIKEKLCLKSNYLELLGKLKKCNSIQKIQDYLKNCKMDINSFFIICKINAKEDKIINENNFIKKLKVLNKQFSNEFLKDVFDEIFNIQNPNDNQSDQNKEIISKFSNKYVEDKTIKIDDIFHTLFDVYHLLNPNEKRSDTLYKHMKKIIIQLIKREELKEKFNINDTQFTGKIDLNIFVNIIYPSLKEHYSTEDISNFVITRSLVDANKFVNYPQFLELIFSNIDDNLILKVVSKINDYIKSYCNSSVKIFFEKFSINKFSINQLFNTIKEHIFLGEFDMEILWSLDVDKDGLISQEDLNFFLKKIECSDEYKFSFKENKELMDYNQFKQITKKIKQKLSAKGISLNGLLKLLDPLSTGFVTAENFKKYINLIFPLSQTLKDSYFNYIDFYKIGMINHENFLIRFREYETIDLCPQNSIGMKNELQLLRLINNYCTEKKINVEEFFAMLDSDSDGLVDKYDLERFFKSHHLQSSSNGDFKKDSYLVEIKDENFERVVQFISKGSTLISRSRQSESGSNSLHEAMENYELELEKKDNKCSFTKHDLRLFINRKSDFFINSEDSKLESNKFLIDNVMEKLGFYISEQYESIEECFTSIKAAFNSKQDYLTMNEFGYLLKEKSFISTKLRLTQDEILILFSYIDSHKKSFITLDDLKLKLSKYNFYSSVHDNIRTFLQENFINSEFAFNFFAKENNIVKEEVFIEKLSKIMMSNFTFDSLRKYLSKLKKLLSSKPEDWINFSHFKSLFYSSDMNIEWLESQIKDKKSLPQLLNFSNILKETKIKNKKKRTYDFWDFNPIDNNEETSFKNKNSDDNNQALEKVKTKLKLSRFNYMNYFNMYLILNNGLLTEYQFKNMLKNFNLGLSYLEIQSITDRCSKNNKGELNLKDFIKFLTAEDEIQKEISKSVIPFVRELKKLIITFHGNPRIAINSFIKNYEVEALNFNQFSEIVLNIFEKAKMISPNFTILQNLFRFLDIKQDGVIDSFEWNKIFSEVEFTKSTKQDEIVEQKNFTTLSNKCKFTALSNDFVGNKFLRDWETSDDYNMVLDTLYKNKKQILSATRDLLKKENLRGNILESKRKLIMLDDLVLVLNILFSNLKLSNSQWKIIGSAAQICKTGKIDLEMLFNLAKDQKKKNF